jgi:hypothetical protein
MSNSNRIKAEIATVQIGHLEIEGLYAEEIGQYFVSVPQIANLFASIQDRHGNEVRTVKAILGNVFKTVKLKTPFNKNITLGVSIDGFVFIIKTLNKRGDEVAEQLMDDLIGLSLHQLFADAFNIKFEQEERQAWLKARQQGKIARRTLTDAIKDWLLAHPEVSENKKKFIYSNVTDAINLGIFARRASKLRKDWHCDNPRDEMTDKELSVVESAEGLTMRLIDQDKLEPMVAVHEALNRLIIPVVER